MNKLLTMFALFLCGIGTHAIAQCNYYLSPYVRPGAAMNSLLVSWSSEDYGANFYLEYGPSGFELGDGSQIAGFSGASEMSTNIVGLEENSTYDVYLWEVCGEGISTDTVMKTGHTGSECASEIDDLYFRNETHESVGISWNSDNLWGSYRLEYGPSGFTPGTGVLEEGIFSSNSAMVELDGLAPETSYDVYLTEVCRSGEEISSSNPETFSTTGICSASAKWFSANPDTSSAVISFETQNVGREYFVEVRAFNSGQDEVMVYSGTTYSHDMSIFLDGLNPGTYYEYSYQELCANGDTTAAISSGFNTRTPCEINYFYLDNSDDHPASSIELSWNTTNVGLTYYVEYGPHSFVPGEGTIVQGTIDRSDMRVSIDGLEPETLYDFHLHEDCHNGGVTSTKFDSWSTRESNASGGGNCGIAYFFEEVISDAEVSLVLETEVEALVDFEIEFGTQGFQRGEGSVITGEVFELTFERLTDLQAETAYDVYVTISCGDSVSTTAGPLTLETPAPCSLIQEFEVNVLNHESAFVYWVSRNAGHDFTLEYGAQGFQPGEGTEVAGQLMNGHYGIQGLYLENLSEASEYDIYIQETCSLGEGPVLGPVTFETEEAADSEPANSACSSAQNIEVGQSYFGTTLNAVFHKELQVCGYLAEGFGVWYKIAGTGDILKVDVCGTDFDPIAIIYKGPCDAFECIGGEDDDDANSCSNSPLLEFQSEVGEDYYVFVTGYGIYDKGSFSIEVTTTNELNTCQAPQNVHMELNGDVLEVRWESQNLGGRYYVFGTVPGVPLQYLDFEVIHASGEVTSSLMELSIPRIDSVQGNRVFLGEECRDDEFFFIEVTHDPTLDLIEYHSRESGFSAYLDNSELFIFSEEDISELRVVGMDGRPVALKKIAENKYLLVGDPHGLLIIKGYSADQVVRTKVIRP